LEAILRGLVSVIVDNLCGWGEDWLVEIIDTCTVKKKIVAAFLKDNGYPAILADYEF